MIIDEVAENILKGVWPEEHLTPDQQLEVIHLLARSFINNGGNKNPEKIRDKVNTAALWIGGLHPDMQVYAWQYIRRQCKIEVHADDKTAVRMGPLEDKIFHGVSYMTTRAKDVTKYFWPKVFLDGTTQEERLEALLEKLDTGLDSETLTGDLVLSGQARGPADTFEENCRVIKESCEGLKALLEKYGKPNVLFDEQADRFVRWCMTLDLELSIMAVRSALAIHGLPIIRQDHVSEAIEEFTEKFQEFMPR